MASEQVKSVLDHTRQYHTRISSLFSQMAADCPDPRACMLLDYLSGHERDLATAIERIEEETPNKVLETWVSTSEDSAHLVGMLQQEDTPSASAAFDEFVEWGLKADNHALRVYEDLALRAEPSWLRDMFQRMYDMERQEEKRVAVQTLRGIDL